MKSRRGAKLESWNTCYVCHEFLLRNCFWIAPQYRAEIVDRVGLLRTTGSASENAERQGVRREPLSSCQSMRRGDDQQVDFGSSRSGSPIERIFTNDRFSCPVEAAYSELLWVLGSGIVERQLTVVESHTAEKKVGVSDGV
jgi:hypothetical protein